MNLMECILDYALVCANSMKSGQIYNVYKATPIQWDIESHDAPKTIKDLSEMINSSDGTPIESQIFLTDQGHECSTDTSIQDIISSNITIFMYDKRIIEEETIILPAEVPITDIEPLVLDDPTSIIPKSIIQTWIHLLFNAGHEHYTKASFLYNQLEILTCSIQAAYMNLMTHLNDCKSSYQSLFKNSALIIANDEQLFSTFEFQCQIMKNLTFIKKMRSIDPNNQLIHLSDAFSISELEILNNQCEKKHETLVKYLDKLENLVSNLSCFKKCNDSIDNLQISLEDRKNQLNEANRLVGRFDIIQYNIDLDIIKLNSSIHASAIQSNESVKELVDIESRLGNMLLEFVKSKESFTHSVHQELGRIALLQTDITTINGYICPSLDILQERIHDLPPLIRFHQFPVQYLCTLMEMIRRTKYIQWIQYKLKDFVESLSMFRHLEEQKRSKFQRDIGEHFQHELIRHWKTTPPLIELTIPTIQDDEELITCQDINELIEELDRLPKQKNKTTAKWIEKLHSMAKQILYHMKHSEFDREQEKIMPEFFTNDPWESSSKSSIKHEDEIDIQEQLKTYEHRIVSLESLLQQSYSELKKKEIDCNQSIKSIDELKKKIQEITLERNRLFEQSKENRIGISFQETLQIGDLVLFLPTVNTKLWAAFHPISGEKYYLSHVDYEKYINDSKKKGWIIGKIEIIKEKEADIDDHIFPKGFKYCELFLNSSFVLTSWK